MLVASANRIQKNEEEKRDLFYEELRLDIYLQKRPG
jgi:hypothetical protein